MCLPGETRLIMNKLIAERLRTRQLIFAVWAKISASVCIYIYTVFPRSDAAATIYFIAQFSAATIRGRPLIEGGVYYIERFTGYTAMHKSSLNPFENCRSCLNTIEKPSRYNASCFLRGEMSKI